MLALRAKQSQPVVQAELDIFKKYHCSAIAREDDLKNSKTKGDVDLNCGLEPNTLSQKRAKDKVLPFGQAVVS